MTTTSGGGLGFMDEPYNQERSLRKKYGELRVICSRMAYELNIYARLIEENSGNAEDIREVLGELEELKADHDR